MSAPIHALRAEARPDRSEGWLAASTWPHHREASGRRRPRAKTELPSGRAQVSMRRDPARGELDRRPTVSIGDGLAMLHAR